MVTTQTPMYPPTIGDSYSNGWSQFKKFFLELLLVGIISFLFALPVSLPRFLGNTNIELDKLQEPFTLPVSVYFYILFGIAYYVLLLNPLKYGISYVYLKAARNEFIEVRDMFSFTSNYPNAVLAGLLSGFIIGIGFIMLIIPGIVFACKLAFVPYLVIDKKMDAIGAMKASWSMTDGHAVDIFVMAILTIPIFLVGLIMLIVGMIPAIMWIRMSFASLYHAVDRMKAPKM